jgi:hypothetical protein
MSGMAADRNARTDRDSQQTARAVRVRISCGHNDALARPHRAERVPLLAPWSLLDWSHLGVAGEATGGQVATVQAADGDTTVLGGLAADVVLLTTRGVVRADGCRTIWRLQDHPPSATSASW